MSSAATPTRRYSARKPRYHYNARSLLSAIAILEAQFGVDSTEVLAAQREGRGLPGLPRFEQHVWASMLEDLQRLRAPAEPPDVLGRVARALVAP